MKQNSLLIERHIYDIAPEKNIYPVRLQADLLVGSENSISFPRCRGGSHFTRFENLVGM